MPRPTRRPSAGVPRDLVAAADLPGTPSDLKLFVDFGDGAPGEGSYVRVAAREPGPAGTRVRAVFTSLAESDRVRLERLLGPGVSPQVR